MKLRQRIALGLCTFYLVSVIGIALSLHFCGGKLSSIHFTKRAECSACKKSEKAAMANKCCKNTDVKAKITDSHETGFKVSLPKNFSIQSFLTPIFSEFMELVLPKLFNRAENKAPPLSARFSLHVFYCVFRN